MLVVTSERLGTNSLVAKKAQAKFYVDGEKLKQVGAVFDRQGVSFTEGMARLMDLLLAVPDVMTPLLLRQAPGDAARAIAELVLDAPPPPFQRRIGVTRKRAPGGPGAGQPHAEDPASPKGKPQDQSR